jgi:hypothetical protein
VDVDLLQAGIAHVGEGVRHAWWTDQGSRPYDVDRPVADSEPRTAFLNDEDLGVGVRVQGDALTWRHVDDDERDARAMSAPLELSRVLELLETNSGWVVVGHGRSLFRASVYGLDMPRRRRHRDTQPTAKPKSSDQAPGEEVVQVNDQYRGGEPAPNMKQEEQAQHQTGG